MVLLVELEKKQGGFLWEYSPLTYWSDIDSASLQLTGDKQSFPLDHCSTRELRQITAVLDMAE